jgi:hypothetical protein
MLGDTGLVQNEPQTTTLRGRYELNATQTRNMGALAIGATEGRRRIIERRLVCWQVLGSRRDGRGHDLLVRTRQVIVVAFNLVRRRVPLL